MTDRPILFSAPMVVALLAGTKTQTRRVIDFDGIDKVIDFVRVAFDRDNGVPIYEMKDAAGQFVTRPAGKHVRDYHYSPRFAVGDQLYVREAWQTGSGPNGPQISYRATPDFFDIDAWDGPDEGIGPSFNYDRCRCAHFHHWLPDVISSDGPWRTPLHMPRWASRLTLIVTEVRVQRLQEISEADAVAEGCFKGKASGRVFANSVAMHLGGDEWANARDWYADLWDRLNDERGYGWDTNPWVVAVSFTPERRNIDQVVP